MDWQFKVGIGVAILFGLLPFVVKDMPHWVTWPGLTVGGMLILWGLLPRHDEFSVAPTATFIVLAAGAAASAAWIYDLLPDSSTTGIISLNCHQEMLPKTFGPNEIVSGLNLFPLPIANGGAGLVEFSNHSGKEWQWRIQEGLFGGNANRCEITNYSDAPILDVEIILDLSFYEAVPTPNQPNSISMGSLALRRPWTIRVQKIDIGPSSRFTFYIYNGTYDKVVTVLLPKTAELRRLRETKRRVVTLDVPEFGGEVPMQFWPIHDAKNDASTPQK